MSTMLYRTIQGGNRPQPELSSIVGESAVQLAGYGLQSVPLDPELLTPRAGRCLRARRDRARDLGEFRAVSVETESFQLVSMAFVPDPGLDLPVYAAEIVATDDEVVGAFDMYAGRGTWFASQHAKEAVQNVRRMLPEVVPEVSVTPRGFDFQVRRDPRGLGVLDDLHRYLWRHVVDGMLDAVRLKSGDIDRNQKSLHVWKVHRRTLSLGSQMLARFGDGDARDCYAAVIAG